MSHTLFIFFFLSLEDFELVQPLLQDNSACYILYRLDEKDNQGNYKWIFFSFTPNDAPVSASQK